ncbi:unnamed protein product, partial [Mesorhabditis spiculigera]
MAGTEVRRRRPSPSEPQTSDEAKFDQPSASQEPCAARNYGRSKNAYRLPWPVRHFPYYCFYGFWFIFGLLVIRKTNNAISAVRYVKAHGPSVGVDILENSREFDALVRMLDREFMRPPAFLMLNQFALNMTDNFLCNTQSLGVHDRFIFVTLDTVARDAMRKRWPNIRQFHWPTPSLYKPFSFAEGPYQMIYLLRANLAISLIRRGKSFWMMQQDTFWRKNLFDLNYEDDLSYDAIFDQIGIDETSERAEWVNGANWFIRAGNNTLEFFERLSDKLAHWYTPDMGIMIHQCHTWGSVKCAYIPHKVAHSWEWMYTDQQHPPHIIQLDCETDGGSKLMQLGKFGFHFTNRDGTCNEEKVLLARARMANGTVSAGYQRATFPSWGRLQFKAYWYIVDCIIWTPYIGPLLKPYLPLVGYILMITM